MSVPDGWQVLADCPHCRVEAAIVEWMDPLHPPCTRGLPAELRCRCCGYERRTDADGTWVDVRAPSDLRDEARARAALARWSEEEGESDPEVFCVANLGGSEALVVALLVAGEPVPTTFDVIAFLFPTGGGGGGGAGRPLELEHQLPRVTDGWTDEVEVIPEVPEQPMDPRTPARVLVSVMVADGTLRAAERAFVVAFLEREGLAAMTPDDLRVWRAAELGPPPPPDLRDRLLEAAVHLMHLDRQREGSEWRVIRAFAKAWGVPDERLRAWDQGYDRKYTSAMTRLGLLIHRILRG
ncbi:MAG: hypothetical protein H6738_08365 [Alphaproteobacteria bacterium]|nr:hypothetical protein [Alphaproteobacteria bacterium]MCB9696774.1 hypothetical protein [Alphaproteobacteria bacterium]